MPKSNISKQTTAKAKEFGADLAGIASIADLKRSPSHTISEKLADFDGIGTKDTTGKKRGVVQWPPGAKSVVVIAVAHPRNQPELDWWVDGNAGGTSGNYQLIQVVSKLTSWLENEGVAYLKIPYHIERGGVYLKDAAVLAGLGCIGKNNILITPEYGPRVRLRAILLDTDLPSLGPIDFDPCENCPEPCQSACPQNAFAKQIYLSSEYGQAELPGRNGVYSRLACNHQMVADESNFEAIKLDQQEKLGKRVKYCRECEFSCPIGAEV